MQKESCETTLQNTGTIFCGLEGCFRFSARSRLGTLKNCTDGSLVTSTVWTCRGVFAVSSCSAAGAASVKWQVCAAYNHLNDTAAAEMQNVVCAVVEAV